MNMNKLPFRASNYEILTTRQDSNLLKELFFGIRDNMHPYEKLFAALRDKRSGWKINDDGELRRNGICPVAVGTGGNDHYYVDDDARCCLGMNCLQTCYATMAADGCSYETCGYEDLARKLKHYLGVKG